MPAKTKRKPQAARPARQTTRKTARTRKSNSRGSDSGRRLILPAFLSLCIVICLGAIGFLGYRTVTASDFFDVNTIEVDGVARSSKKDIERIVAMHSERAGVWNADLGEIKQRVERLPFVESAAVSRVLPNGLRVYVREFVPQAIIRVGRGDFLVGPGGEVLAPVEGNEENLPFPMLGWDEMKSEAAWKSNVERIRAYRKMLAEWQEQGIANRVRHVDLADLKSPRAVVEDSKHLITIDVGKENFGRNLSNGIKAVAGKGDQFEAVNLVGPNIILAPRPSKTNAK